MFEKTDQYVRLLLSLSIPSQRLAAWLIESGADPNAVDDSGQTALHLAMECDNFAVVSTLARKGGDVNLKRRSDGRSVVRKRTRHLHAHSR